MIKGEGIMILFLNRFARNDKYTVGVLYVDNCYFCDTLELPLYFNGKANIVNETAIPAGVYDCGITYSPSFKRNLIEIKNVPNRMDIRIHSGNVPQDSKGCILVGKNTTKGMVLQSKESESKLFDLAAQAIGNGDKMLIQIV
jgi:hypothetical protein